MMKGEKVDRPSVGAPGRPEGSGACEASSDPIAQSTTAPLSVQAVKIADFLCIGQAHAIPLRDLVSLTGWSERDVRRQIEQERRDFVPIVSDNRHGYWLADDSGEAQRFAQSMLHRSCEIAKTARAVEAAAERMVSADDL